MNELRKASGEWGKNRKTPRAKGKVKTAVKKAVRKAIKEA